jgi:hypothetical protein
MSWSFSPELVAAFSEACCSDTERSAQSNTTPMPDQYCWPDKPTEHSRLSRFGMTYELLTADHGAALLTWFLADSRAKTSVQPEQGPESTESEADCGARWHGSFARYDQSSSAWKTAQCSLVEGLDEFSETWPRWGSMRNGVSYLRQIPALPICVSESGLWPTPTVCGNYNRPGASATSGMGLASAVKLWPTPVASMSKGSSPGAMVRKSGASRENDRLDHAVQDSKDGRLNPNWVEWLMGWPIGWTDLKPLETARFQEWWQQHGIY